MKILGNLSWVWYHSFPRARMEALSCDGDSFYLFTFRVLWRMMLRDA